jgi:hypothetical protein
MSFNYSLVISINRQWSLYYVWPFVPSSELNFTAIASEVVCSMVVLVWFTDLRGTSL